jgi:hypothetical protein
MRPTYSGGTVFSVLLVLTIVLVGMTTYVVNRGSNASVTTSAQSCGQVNTGSESTQAALVQLTGNTVLIVADQPLYGSVAILGPANRCITFDPWFVLKNPSNQTAVKVVENWVEGSGITSLILCSSYSCGLPGTIQSNMTIGQAESLLNVQFNVYRSRNMTFWSNSADPWVPESVAQTLSGIWGLDNISYQIIV